MNMYLHVPIKKKFTDFYKKVNISMDVDAMSDSYHSCTNSSLCNENWSHWWDVFAIMMILVVIGYTQSTVNLTRCKLFGTEILRSSVGPIIEGLPPPLPLHLLLLFWLPFSWFVTCFHCGVLVILKIEVLHLFPISKVLEGPWQPERNLILSLPVILRGGLKSNHP